MMKKGRPRIEFFRDPDRHELALALAYQAMGASLRGGCEIAVAAIEGLPVADNLDRRYGGHGLGLLDWRYELKVRPRAAASIEGRARGLRQKLKAYLKDAAAARWLYGASNLWLAALQPTAGTTEAALLQMGELLGEADFVRERLLPILRLRTAKK
jgi:hypothetical protein